MPTKIPDDIKDRSNKMHSEVKTILDAATKYLQTDVSGPISFSFTHSAPTDILTEYERAQSICFIARYEALPIFKNVKIQEIDGKYHFGNYSEAHYVLNEYRPIIQNKKDSTYYKKLHKYCREKLLNDDPAKGLSIEINHKERVI